MFGPPSHNQEATIVEGRTNQTARAWILSMFTSLKCEDVVSIVVNVPTRFTACIELLFQM